MPLYLGRRWHLPDRMSDLVGHIMYAHRHSMQDLTKALFQVSYCIDAETKPQRLERLTKGCTACQ